jgi:hypothetical protein
VREQRDELAGVIRSFLDEQITAFKFDELLDEFRESTDETIRYVTGAAWYHYDDCDDHFVTLSKPEWDYFQRLLLLLESDNQIEITTKRRWHWSQVVALAALAGFLWLAVQVGWGSQLLIAAIPFGVVSISISYLRARTGRDGPYDAVLSPFASFAELKSTFDSVTTFRKTRYPRTLERRRIRSPLLNFAYQLQFFAGWLMFSPVPLLVQTLPVTETRTRIKAT